MSKKPPRAAKPGSAIPGGQGAAAPAPAGTVAEARAKAIESAPDAVQALRDILKKPPRNAMAKLAAARELLRFAEGNAGGGGALPPAPELTADEVATMQRFLEERQRQRDDS